MAVGSVLRCLEGATVQKMWLSFRAQPASAASDGPRDDLRLQWSDSRN